MMSDRVQLERVLRRALHRAGIVTGWIHKCRRKGCGHSEPAPDAGERRCPRCNVKLCPAGQVRAIRFHHLRHTTASLLVMAGANPAAVQRILRHSDPRITAEVCGHLAPDMASGSELAGGAPKVSRSISERIWEQDVVVRSRESWSRSLASAFRTG